MSDDRLVGIIEALRDDINRNHKSSEERLARADARQDKLESTLGDLADNMGTLATSMARLEEVTERIERDSERQREIDELQNHRLETLKDDWHEADKKLDALKDAPEEIRSNRHGLNNTRAQVEALTMITEEHRDDIKDIKKSIATIKEDVVKDSVRLDSMAGWSKWFKEKILPTIVLAGVPAAAVYYVLQHTT